MRSDLTNLADEPSKTTGAVKWRRMPEIRESEAMDSVSVAAGYYGMNALADTSVQERIQLYKLLSGPFSSQ